MITGWITIINFNVFPLLTIQSFQLYALRWRHQFGLFIDHGLITFGVVANVFERFIAQQANDARSNDGVVNAASTSRQRKVKVAASHQVSSFRRKLGSNWCFKAKFIQRQKFLSTRVPLHPRSNSTQRIEENTKTVLETNALRLESRLSQF